MDVERYLAAIDAKLSELSGLVVSWTIQRDLDANLGWGFIRGRIIFVDGSRLELSEQIPVRRRKYRFQYMDWNNELIARWDSAPHHRHLSNFPFHKHTPEGIEDGAPITLVAVLDEIARLVRT